MRLLRKCRAAPGPRHATSALRLALPFHRRELGDGLLTGRSGEELGIQGGAGWCGSCARRATAGQQGGNEARRWGLADYAVGQSETTRAPPTRGAPVGDRGRAALTRLLR